MKADVTIVICYQVGTLDMLEVCLRNVKKYTRDVNYRIAIVSRTPTTELDCLGLLGTLRVPGYEYVHVDVGPQEISSHVHGMMLDVAVPQVETEYVLTLDSDCFPIAEGWLSGLLAMMQEERAGCVGILHPYAPPPSNMPVTLLEFRVRSQHCWSNTHVACQMVPTKLVGELGLEFRAGDDTGLLVPARIREAGYKVRGYKATRCPKPAGGMDGEFNRYFCLVFGDKVYHHAGFTRSKVYQDRDFLEAQFGWARDRVLGDRGAEFLLNDECSHRFEYNREDEVAKDKMSRLFGLRAGG